VTYKLAATLAAWPSPSERSYGLMLLHHGPPPHGCQRTLLMRVSAVSLPWTIFPNSLKCLDCDRSHWINLAGNF
jgi:hypothetical protein